MDDRELGEPASWARARGAGERGRVGGRAREEQEGEEEEEREEQDKEEEEKRGRRRKRWVFKERMEGGGEGRGIRKRVGD